MPTTSAVERGSCEVSRHELFQRSNNCKNGHVRYRLLLLLQLLTLIFRLPIVKLRLVIQIESGFMLGEKCGDKEERGENVKQTARLLLCSFI